MFVDGKYQGEGILYYDNGQIEVARILSSVFNALLENVEFRRVIPADYRLFQVADLICTLKLTELKAENHTLYCRNISIVVLEGKSLKL